MNLSIIKEININQQIFFNSYSLVLNFIPFFIRINFLNIKYIFTLKIFILAYIIKSINFLKFFKFIYLKLFIFSIILQLISFSLFLVFLIYIFKI